ncbi:conserved hypothetical protein [Culex quinquefasciatus]|uniref:Uncharacterized protein n=1 Tax=Culex quinquefasciatus TaxID=7176 RepID=B0X7B8_CULQU|nr:conserved hypothetical protein [Culex quinquefasciatus]|eukprot:XP_001865540.1 conserved hypothetical protein [Culex quinquefasciatus]
MFVLVVFDCRLLEARDVTQPGPVFFALEETTVEATTPEVSTTEVTTESLKESLRKPRRRKTDVIVPRRIYRDQAVQLAAADSTSHNFMDVTPPGPAEVASARNQNQSTNNGCAKWPTVTKWSVVLATKTTNLAFGGSGTGAARAQAKYFGRQTRKEQKRQSVLDSETSTGITTVSAGLFGGGGSVHVFVQLSIISSWMLQQQLHHQEEDKRMAWSREVEPEQDRVEQSNANGKTVHLKLCRTEDQRRKMEPKQAAARKLQELEQ